MNYLEFRSRALQSLTLVKPEDRKKLITQTDVEDWIKGEYERHYSKIKGERERG